MAAMQGRSQGLKKGSNVTAEPVRSVQNIKAISKLLSDKPRDLLLWTMGINNGLRASDLVKLKVKQVSRLKVGDTLDITEQKTKKQNILVINKTTHKALANYLKKCRPKNSEYLFKSRKGTNNPLTSQTVGRLIKGWCQAINLPGQYSSHTLRKTWGYQMRTAFGTGVELMCERYNHSNPAVTMRYLGIADREIHGVLMNDIG